MIIFKIIDRRRTEMTKMATAKATPPTSLWDLQRQLFGAPLFRGKTEDLGFAGYGPAIDIFEDEEGFYLSADVPGYTQDSFQIRYENRTLTITGERRQEEVEGVRYHRRESFSGRFQRSFTLPLEIEADKITAELKDGVLTIFLPKHETSKPRQISVKVS
jgi:HSP20 family protein